MYVLGAIVVIGFFITLAFMISTKDYKEEVNMIVGALIGAFMTVIGFFYGSSKGSADKNDLLNKQNNK